MPTLGATVFMTTEAFTVRAESESVILVVFFSKRLLK